MQYRKLGNSGLSVSVLGFGCMRLPVSGSDNAGVDINEASRMIRYAIDSGVNYIDTAYNYHGRQGENVVGKALEDGYRERVFVATKCPVWLLESPDDFDKYLSEQLDRLATDYIDFYLLHSLNQGLWDKAKKLKVLESMENACKRGLIRYLGFSFHDTFEVFREIVDAYEWALALIHLNYVDDYYQAGLAGMKYAASKGLGVVAMEPLRGGKLAHSVPHDVQAVWDKAKIQRTPAEWGFRWVWNHPEVSCVLSGMSSIEQVIENLRIADKALPNSLTDEDLRLIGEAKSIYKERIKIPCTECNYCVPCPNNVAIPDVFSVYNDFFAYGAEDSSRESYAYLKKVNGDPAACTECKKCEDLCPQHLPITHHLKEAKALFEG
jgi:predicted aldo/keto reductase-like oxidoreductase